MKAPPECNQRGKQGGDEKTRWKNEEENRKKAYLQFINSKNLPLVLLQVTETEHGVFALPIMQIFQEA